MLNCLLRYVSGLFIDAIHICDDRRQLPASLQTGFLYSLARAFRHVHCDLIGQFIYVWHASHCILEGAQRVHISAKYTIML